MNNLLNSEFFKVPLLKIWILRVYEFLARKVIFLIVKINNDSVVFDHFNGLDIGCNPGSIAKQISQKHSSIKKIWLLKEGVTGRHREWLSYTGNSFLSKCYALASAKVVVFNTLNSMSAWPKKKGQIWIQTGHGSFGIKKVGMDVDTSRKGLIQREARKTDLFLSNSSFETEVFMGGFLFKRSQVVEIGHARNDIFFDANLKASVKERICCHYGLADKNVILFAPTYGKGDLCFIKSSM